MSSDDNFRDLFDLAEDVFGLIDENEDRIRSVIGSNKVQLGEGEMMKELHKSEDEIRIVAETKEEFSKVNVKKSDGDLFIEFNDKSLMSSVPDDVRIEDSRVLLNNGVLEVTVPRGDEDGDR